MLTSSDLHAPAVERELVRLKDSSEKPEIHPALRWAEPFIAYAFARTGHDARGETAGFQAFDLEYRDPEKGIPWLSPDILDRLAEELERTLNFLGKTGPGGRFSVRKTPRHLHLEWSREEKPKNARVQDPSGETGT